MTCANDLLCAPRDADEQPAVGVDEARQHGKRHSRGASRSNREPAVGNVCPDAGAVEAQPSRSRGLLRSTRRRVGNETWGERETVTGAVTGATRAPMGELNGFVLDSGIVVKFPPHIGCTLPRRRWGRIHQALLTGACITSPRAARDGHSRVRRGSGLSDRISLSDQAVVPRFREVSANL